LKCHHIFFPYRPGLTSMQHAASHTTTVQPSSHNQRHVLIGRPDALIIIIIILICSSSQRTSDITDGFGRSPEGHCNSFSVLIYSSWDKRWQVTDLWSSCRTPGRVWENVQMSRAPGLHWYACSSPWYSNISILNFTVTISPVSMFIFYVNLTQSSP